MNLNRAPIFTALLWSALLLTSPVAHAGERRDIDRGPVITQSDFITGTMNITFDTRVKRGAVGVKDNYKVDLRIGGTTEFDGVVTRLPRLVGPPKDGFSPQVLQNAQLNYALKIAVRNPKNLKERQEVGSWSGTAPIDSRGVYAFGPPGGNMRITVQFPNGQGLIDGFDGKLIGKPTSRSAAKKRTYIRTIRGKQFVFSASQIDPMTFDNLVLAAGPTANYSTTTVNGKMDYDYDSANWFIDDLRFQYTVNSTIVEDRLSGTIRWVEDDDRATNGRGYYDFNVRFNDIATSAPLDESAAFGDATAPDDEEAFFAIDTTIPSLTGRIEYVDILIKGREVPSMSKVTYHLNATRLTKQQAMAFIKLWLLAIGPTNDE